MGEEKSSRCEGEPHGECPSHLCALSLLEDSCSPPKKNHTRAYGRRMKARKGASILLSGPIVFFPSSFHLFLAHSPCHSSIPCNGPEGRKKGAHPCSTGWANRRLPQEAKRCEKKNPERAIRPRPPLCEWGLHPRHHTPSLVFPLVFPVKQK